MVFLHDCLIMFVSYCFVFTRFDVKTNGVPESRIIRTLDHG